MAHLYPTQLRPDTKSEAEKKLYRLFEAHLPNDFQRLSFNCLAAPWHTT